MRALALCDRAGAIGAVTERILANLNPLTEYAIAFVSMVGLYFQVVWSRRSIALGPTLLTTLGIFFCFLGIALGLTDFDPNDVKSSVPHLLQGIRTSFWVSVCGIGWALSIKVRFALLGDAGLSATAVHGATVDDLASQLIALNAAIGAKDMDIASHLKAHRFDNNARLERLVHVLETHTERTAQANSAAIVNTLAQVVHDFNDKVSAQFGENFVQLNESVGRLLAWQVQYEQQLNLLMERENAIGRSVTEASTRYVQLVDNAGDFVAVAQSLDGLLRGLNVERDKLKDGLTLLATLIKSASDGLPTIEKHIVEMTNQISRGVQSNQEMLGAVLKSSWQSIQVHNQHLTAILEKSFDAAGREAVV